VIYGENDDAWPLEDQNQMARDLNATLTVLPQCGHCPNEDNPPLTAKALAHFWEMNAD
ncbi:MAG: alpha/beta hydrolase, partial [Actinobacteria bacterium]|nr:alpha/beta hydrolase [Actinomycetota bacterium]